MNPTVVDPPAVPTQTKGGFPIRPFDESGVFRGALDRGGVRQRAVRGAGATMLAQASGLAIQIIATVFLARLLSPADFGLVAMVTTFSLLLVNFGGNGFTEAILKWDEVDDSLASNLFWINVSAGLLLTIAFAAAGTLMARFYGNPRVALIAVAVSLTIFITSTGVLHLALLMRAMHFTLVSANDVIARVASVTVSILLARAGWGYWALVGGLIAQPLSLSLGAWTMCRWVPGRPRRMPGTPSMVRFAIHVYGRFCLNYFARNVDNLLVGWRFNAQALGFYKKAYDLFALSAMVQSLTNVGVSALSRLSHDPVQYRRHLLRALSVAAFIGMGIGGDLTLVGRDVIRVLLGPGWEEAGRIFTFFGAGFGAMFLYGIHGWIHLSIGRPDRWFRWGLIEFFFTALLFVVALPWGPVGVATSWSLSLWALTMPAWWYAGRPIGFGVGPMSAAVWKYVAASVVAGCATVAIIGGLPSFALPTSSIASIVRTLKISALFSTLYIGSVVVLYRSLSPLHQVAALIQEMIPRRRVSTPASPSAVTVAGQTGG